MQHFDVHPAPLLDVSYIRLLGGNPAASDSHVIFRIWAAERNSLFVWTFAIPETPESFGRCRIDQVAFVYERPNEIFGQQSFEIDCLELHNKAEELLQSGLVSLETPAVEEDRMLITGGASVILEIWKDENYICVHLREKGYRVLDEFMRFLEDVAYEPFTPGNQSDSKPIVKPNQQTIMD